MKKMLAILMIVAITGYSFQEIQTTYDQPGQPPAITSDSAELVNLLSTLAATEKNPLLKRHFESVALITKDQTHGYAFSEDDQKNARGTLEFFKGEGAKWETYLNKPRPLIMAFTSKTDKKNSYYWLFIPKDFDAKRKTDAFFIELHGSGGGKNNNPHVMLYFPLQPNQERPGGVTNEGYRRDGYMIFPWGRGDKGYRDTAETDIWECLQDFDAMFKTDPKRQYMYGFSMGGAGTYNLSQKSLDRWTAIAMYSGGARNPTVETVSKFKDKNIPVWLAWGEQETRAAENNRALRDTLQKAGVQLEWTEIKGVGHKYLGEYQENMLNWLKKQSKK